MRSVERCDKKWPLWGGFNKCKGMERRPGRGIKMKSRAAGRRGLFTDGEVLRGRRNPCVLASFAARSIREGLHVVC